MSDVKERRRLPPDYFWEEDKPAWGVEDLQIENSPPPDFQKTGEVSVSQGRTGDSYLQWSGGVDVKCGEIEGIVIDETGSPPKLERHYPGLRDDSKGWEGHEYVTHWTPAKPAKIAIRTISGGTYRVECHRTHAKVMQRALLSAWREGR